MEQELRRILKTPGVIGRELLCFDVLDSTNTYGKQLALQGAADGTVIIADRQTAGRGRMARTFQSPGGKGLYCSVLLRPHLPAEHLQAVTALAAVAVCHAVERVCGLRPGVKWPNDPVLNGRKVGGILTELVTPPGEKPCVVLGIGINVSQAPEDFTPEVAAMASSLAQEASCPISRVELAAALLEELEAVYEALCAGYWDEYLERYRRDCVNLGKPVQLLRGETRETVTAVAVDDLFGLVVRRGDGTEETVRSGEVSVRGLYGYVE